MRPIRITDLAENAHRLISEHDLLTRYRAVEGKDGWWYVEDTWKSKGDVKCYCRNYHNKLPNPEGMAKGNAADLNKKGHRTIYPHRYN